MTRLPSLRWASPLLLAACVQHGDTPVDPAPGDASIVPHDASAPVDADDPDFPEDDVPRPPRDVPFVGADDVPAAPDDVPAEDAATPAPPDAPAPPPDASTPPSDAGPAVSCARFAAMANVRLCGATPGGCGVVFSASQGCAAVCAAASMRCVEGREDLSNACGPDTARPALGCGPTGHQSDYCVCAPMTGMCTRSCEGRACGPDGCGGVCGTCTGGNVCAAGQCRPRAPVACSSTDCPAFPGAEGAGRNARGGRGGDVYHVTTLANDGAGSLRRGVTTATGPRTIVFDVGGIIDLTAPLQARVSRLTIAGQTAPGDGVATRGYQVELQGNDLIVQHVRFRAGDIRKRTSGRPDGFTEDSLTVGGNDVIVDHVSASWGIDENLSTFSARWDRLTVQYCIISEGLHRTGLFHGEVDSAHPGHSMGSLFKPREGDSRMSIHHNLYAHNGNRNPAVGSYSASQTITADIRNNVIYDCRNMGYTSGDSRATRINYVGNYGILGASSSSQNLFSGSAANRVTIFQSGNRRDLNRNGRIDGNDDGWSAFGGDYARASAAFDLPAVTTQSASEALPRVLDGAGAMPWRRDATDRRVVEEVRTGRGRIIDSQSQVGGWASYASGSVTDTDRDGMPDDWERAHGCDPARADHNGDVDGDGYTNLENYLHHAARWPR